MHRRNLKFPFSNTRGQTLAGLIDLPDHEPAHYAVFGPCFTCLKELHAAHKVARALAARGVATLRFDPTGLGQSEGSILDLNFSTYVQDLTAACQALTTAYRAPTLLMGHSISGTAALAASRHLPRLPALATLGSPRDPAYVIEKFQRNNQIVIDGDRAQLTVVGHPVTVKKTFVDDMLAHHVGEDTAAYRGKLFIFHAPHDDIVRFENAKIIYDRATCDKELITLSEDATHLLERGAQDAADIADILANWLDTRAS